MDVPVTVIGYETRVAKNPTRLQRARSKGLRTSHVWPSDNETTWTRCTQLHVIGNLWAQQTTCRSHVVVTAGSSKTSDARHHTIEVRMITLAPAAGGTAVCSLLMSTGCDHKALPGCPTLDLLPGQNVGFPPDSCLEDQPCWPHVSNIQNRRIWCITGAWTAIDQVCGVDRKADRQEGWKVQKHNCSRQVRSQHRCRCEGPAWGAARL